MTYVQITNTPYLMQLKDVMEAIDTSDFTKLKEQFKDTPFLEEHDFEQMQKNLIEFIEENREQISTR